MKKGHILLAAALVLGLSGCGRTGGASATDASATDALATDSDAVKVSTDVLTFSQGGGAYAEEFDLAIEAKNGYTIMYTLDGSNPLSSETAIEYTGAIHIGDRSGDANVVTAVDPDLFCANFSEYDKESGVVDCYISAPSDDAVDKCTTVRAIGINNDTKEVTASAANTYFIGTMEEHIEGITESTASTGSDLAVISITMNYDDLFDYETGIYVRGKLFDEALIKESAADANFNAESSRKIAANYNQRGREWEREAHIEFYEANADGMVQQLSQDCGIRIQGNYSRSDLQKGFRLYARKSYGDNNFKYSVFGDDATDSSGDIIDKFSTLVLRAGGNCAFTSKYNDTFWQHAAEGVDCSTKASRACVVYLNGEYWGLYVLEEDYSDDYFEDHYGVNKDDVVLYKGDAETYQQGYKLDIGELPEDEPNHVTYYLDDLLNFFKKHKTLADQADYDEFAELVDVDSVLDYFAVEVWVNNKWDWPGKNWSMWKTTSVDADNPYADGKWRFCIYDIEFGGVSGSSDAYTNTVKEDNYRDRGLLDYNVTNPAVRCFALLMTNENFNTRYCERLNELSETYFDKERLTSLLDAYEGEYGPLFDQFYARYPGSGSTSDALYGGYASSKCIRDFIDKREDYIEPIIEFCKTQIGKVF